VTSIRLLSDDLCNAAIESILTRGYFVVPAEQINYPTDMEEDIGLVDQIHNSAEMAAVHQTMGDLFTKALQIPDEELPTVARKVGQMVNYGYHKPKSDSNDFYIHIWSFGRDSVRTDADSLPEEHFVQAGVMPHMKPHMMLLREYTVRILDVLMSYLYSILLRLPSSINCSVAELADIVLHGDFNLCANLWQDMRSEKDDQERIIVPAHVDITLLSTLFCTEDTSKSSSPLASLQVCSPQTGEWAKVDVTKGSLLILPGMFLQWLSQGQVPACVHRVMLEGKKGGDEVHRLTMPLHLYPDSEQAIPIPAHLLYEHAVLDQSLAV
jgi:hypothetical protein